VQMFVGAQDDAFHRTYHAARTKDSHMIAVVRRFFFSDRSCDANTALVTAD